METALYEKFLNRNSIAFFPEKCIKKYYFSKENWFYSPLSHAVSQITILIIHQNKTKKRGASRNAFPLKELKNILKTNRASRNAFPLKELENILKMFPRFARSAFPVKQLKNIL